MPQKIEYFTHNIFNYKKLLVTLYKMMKLVRYNSSDKDDTSTDSPKKNTTKNKK